MADLIKKKVDKTFEYGTNTSTDCCKNNAVSLLLFMFIKNTDDRQLLIFTITAVNIFNILTAVLGKNSTVLCHRYFEFEITDKILEHDVVFKHEH